MTDQKDGFADLSMEVVSMNKNGCLISLGWKLRFKMFGNLSGGNVDEARVLAPLSADDCAASHVLRPVAAMASKIARAGWLKNVKRVLSVLHHQVKLDKNNSVRGCRAEP